jgi:hypothetical protein
MGIVDTLRIFRNKVLDRGLIGLLQRGYMLKRYLTVEEPFKTEPNEVRIGLSKHEDGVRTGRERQLC